MHLVSFQRVRSELFAQKIGASRDLVARLCPVRVTVAGSDLLTHKESLEDWAWEPVAGTEKATCRLDPGLSARRGPRGRPAMPGLRRWLPPLAELIEEGGVLALNMPAGANPALGRAIGVLLKNAWMQALLRRPAELARRPGRYFRHRPRQHRGRIGQLPCPLHTCQGGRRVPDARQRTGRGAPAPLTRRGRRRRSLLPARAD